MARGLSVKRAQALIAGWGTYGLELSFVENSDGTCVHVEAGSGKPSWAEGEAERRKATPEDLVTLTLGVRYTVCGVWIRCNRGGQEEGGRLTPAFADELLCVQCHAAFGDRADLIFECNRQPEESDE